MAIETGLWIVIIIIGSTFTFFAIKNFGKMSMAFYMLAVALWMGLAIIHAGGMEVSATDSNLIYDEDGIQIFNETKTDIFIPGNTSANWLSWVFLSLALLNVGFVFRDVVKL